MFKMVLRRFGLQERSSCASVWAAAALLVPGAALAAAPVVRIDAGLLRGSDEGAVMAFKGIPYAQPPEGPLRWRPPQTDLRWAGEREATRTGPDCAQLQAVEGVGSNEVTPGSSEDCLYLNVYAPHATTDRTKAHAPAPRPVLVFLHGGSGSSGSGAPYVGSEMAASQDVVVVAINYRLGPFGVLALPAMRDEQPALNFALQDQQAALKWVKRNIAAFGGDPGRVTVVGESAGAGSICHHLVSPTAEGLFHRAIMQSGICYSSLTPDLSLADAFRAGQAYAQAAGCPDGPQQLACMRTLPLATVLKAIPPSSATGGASPAGSHVIDAHTLTAQTVGRYRAGDFHRVPVMMGITRHEARVLMAIQYQVGMGRPANAADYEGALAAFGGPIAPLLKAAYPVAPHGSYNNALAAMFTDMAFACPTHAHLRTLADRTPTYAYEFNDPKTPPLPGFAPPGVDDLGAYHAGELQYLFDFPTRQLFDAGQRALSAQMMRYWANFAASGDPNGAKVGKHLDAAPPLPHWPRYHRLTTPYRHLQPGGLPGSLMLGSFQLYHRCPLWDALNVLATLAPAGQAQAAP